MPRQATLADFIKVKDAKQGNRFKALATDDDHAALLLPHDTTRHDPAIRFKTKSPCGSAEPSGIFDYGIFNSFGIDFGFSGYCAGRGTSRRCTLG